jgi:Caspase domain/WD domain, G-beta repeat
MDAFMRASRRVGIQSVWVAVTALTVVANATAAKPPELVVQSGHTSGVRSASFSPDGKSIVTASEDKTAIVWDAASGQKLRTLAGHTGSINSASYSPDGRRIVTASGDGTTRLWDAATGQGLCSLLSFDAGYEWLAVAPQGYYQGSLAAEQYVRWRVEGENGEWPRLVGPEQFRDKFYRPDLFRYLLAEGNVYKALARADAERGPTTRPTNIASELPPIVLVTAPENHANLMQPDLRVKAVATSVGSHPVESLQLELNGQPESKIQHVQAPKLGRVDAEWPAVELRPGENTIRVIAKAGGTTGPSDPVKVTYMSRDRIEVRLRILAIGVDKYKLAQDAGGYKELRKAADGARKVGEAFARYGGGLYSEVLPPKVLIDQEATKDNILDALDQFTHEMAKDDVGVIFYAGHGDKSNDRLYLTTHDTDKTHLLRTSILASQMRDLLVGTKGRVFLFLDACHSGAITQRDGNGDSIHEDLIRELRREATGTVIATACRGDETANEDEEHGGFFTHALVEGLSGAARSPNGAVYAKGLKTYVEERVKELTRPLDARHQQRPYFDGSEELMDVPLVKP